MTTTLRPLIYGDLREMPDDGQRYEIINGELIVNPAPIADHQRVLLQVILLIEEFVRNQRIGELFVAPFNIQIGPHDIVQADLVFIAAERGRVPGTQNTFEGAPDLVVEIMSPSSRRTDLVRKAA